MQERHREAPASWNYTISTLETDEQNRLTRSPTVGMQKSREHDKMNTWASQHYQAGTSCLFMCDKVSVVSSCTYVISYTLFCSKVLTLLKKHCHCFPPHLSSPDPHIIATSKLRNTPDTLLRQEEAPLMQRQKKKRNRLRVCLTAFATVCWYLSSVRHSVHFVVQELKS